MPLSKEEIEKIEEEERMRAAARTKYAPSQLTVVKQKKHTSPLTWLLAILIGIPMFIVIFNSQKQTPTTPQSTLTPEQAAVFNSSPAGQICLKHPSWTKEDCEKLANKKIWIGMTYEMLIYIVGKPDHKNTSNYGEGNQYQYCWDDLNPSCFYDNNGDGIIDAYN